jgi:hypothetical protein
VVGARVVPLASTIQHDGWVEAMRLPPLDSETICDAPSFLSRDSAIAVKIVDVLLGFVMSVVMPRLGYAWWRRLVVDKWKLLKESEAPEFGEGS